jgi:hypothetical protein
VQKAEYDTLAAKDNALHENSVNKTEYTPLLGQTHVNEDSTPH